LTLHVSPAPARPLLRLAGAFVLAALLPLAACEGSKDGKGRADEKGPRELTFGSDTVRLPDSVHVATVRIDRTKAAELEPAETTVRTGDLVRFLSLDAGAHAIAFDGATMASETRAFMERGGQMRSPPFMAAGSSWVVSFKDAPPGAYPFRCPTHGVQGTVTVTAR
jgi:plastocyanin